MPGMTLLARDPNWLYVYWDNPPEKSDTLKVTNSTTSESFLVRINEFSDSWYINVPHPGNLYMAELGRKLPDGGFTSVLTSNSAFTPANQASFDATVSFVDRVSHRIHDPAKDGSDFPGSSGLYSGCHEGSIGVSSDSFGKG